MALPIRRVDSGRVDSKIPAKPRGMWVKVVPLVAALAISGVVAAKTIFGGNTDEGAEVWKEKRTPQEIKSREKLKRQKAKLEMLKGIIKFQKMKEQGKIGWGENEDKSMESFPVFDGKRYMEALWEYEKDELWELFAEQCGTVEHLEKEHKDALDDMDIELSTGKRFPSEEEEKEENLVLAKLNIEKRKRDLVQGRIDEIELSEYGLAGKNREELQSILFSMEEMEVYWGVESMPWEKEQTMYLASIALDRLFWTDVFGSRD